jgi:putative transposase
VENAFIESFNGRLRDECLNSHVFGSVAEAQSLFDAWRRLQSGPTHSALQDRTPLEWVQHVTESREARDSVSINEVGGENRDNRLLSHLSSAAVSRGG